MKKISFNQIAGYEKEKEDLESLANILKNYQSIKDMGGRMPKGLLLQGPNGVGKTILSSAFINKSGLNVSTVSCRYKEDDFNTYIEGVFKYAKAHRPCIIYIEELDKIAAQRDSFMFGDANYDRFATLLDVMNEYNDVEDIFILATCNERMRMDRSLTRSGRIDKTIRIGLPTQSERLEIFKYYSKNKSISKQVDFLLYASATQYFSGADIESVMNDAVIRACKNNRKTICKEDIENSINDKIFSSLEKNTELNSTYLRVVATHEAGHAVNMLFGPHKNIRRVTVLPRGNVRGYAEQSAQEDKLISVKEKEHMVATLLGGMASEQVFYNTHFDGCSNDINRAINLVNELITVDGIEGYKYLVDYSDIDSPNQSNGLSNKKLQDIEELQGKLIDKYFDESVSLISKHKKLTIMIINSLLEKKILEKEELEAIYNQYIGTLPSKDKNEITKMTSSKFDITWLGNIDPTSGHPFVDKGGKLYE